MLPDKYYDENMMPDDVLITSLEEYMEKFNNFLLKSFDNVLPEDVNEKIFRITIEDIGESVSLVLGKGCVKQGEKNERIPTKEMIIDLAGARALVIGRMNFESFYVGFNGSFKRNPIDVHNKVLIGHLQKFAYIYQKRLVPDSLKKLI